MRREVVRTTAMLLALAVAVYGPLLVLRQAPAARRALCTAREVGQGVDMDAQQWARNAASQQFQQASTGAADAAFNCTAYHLPGLPRVQCSYENSTVAPCPFMDSGPPTSLWQLCIQPLQTLMRFNTSSRTGAEERSQPGASGAAAGGSSADRRSWVQMAAATQPNAFSGHLPRWHFQTPGQRTAAPVTNAQQLVAWAARTGIRSIVFSGDSTQRQLFKGAIGVARGESVLLDFQRQAFAHYAPWPEMSQSPQQQQLLQQQQQQFVDSLWWGPHTLPEPRMDPVKGWAEEAMRQSLAEVVARARSAAASSPPPLLSLHFLVGAAYQVQMQNVAAYAEQLLSTPGAAHASALVVSVCYWEGQQPPAEYAAFLRRMAPLFRAVVLVTCGLRPVGHEPALAARNTFLAQLAASADETPRPFLLLDADAAIENIPPQLQIGAGNVHFQCYFWSSKEFKEGSAVCPRAAISGQPKFYDHVMVPPDGACDDPLNFALVQQLLHLLEGC